MHNKTSTLGVRKYIIFVSVMTLFLSVTFVNAQEESLVVPEEGAVFMDENSVMADVIADIGIYNATVVEQRENELKIEFNLKNNFSKAQADMSYDVRVYKKNEDGSNGEMADRVKSGEIIDLVAGEEILKKIDYKAPAQLKGDYEIWIFVNNSSGMELSLSPVGIVNLKGTGDFLTIKQDSCYLNIKGDDSNEKFSIVQGVDIKAEKETLVLSCEIENSSNKQVSIKAKFGTYLRSLAGVPVEASAVTGGAINLGSQESKRVAIDIPKVSNPQAYEASVMLEDENNQIKSNQITVHYVVQGESATINEVQLDKTDYKKGETIKVSVLASLSADGFYESRINSKTDGEDGTAINNSDIYIKIKDQSGKACAEETIKMPGSLSKLNFNLSSKINCKNPTVITKISSEEGKVLGESTSSFSGEGENRSSNEETLNSESGKLSVKNILIFIAIFIPVAVIIIVLIKNKRTISLFLLLIASIFLYGADADAVTLRMQYMCDDALSSAWGQGDSSKEDRATAAGCKWNNRHGRYQYPFDIGLNVPTIPDPSECIRNGQYANCPDENTVVAVWDTWYGTTDLLRVNVSSVADSGYANVTLNKGMYNPSETIVTSASGGYTVKCGNKAPVIVGSYVAERGDNNAVVGYQEIIRETMKSGGGGYTDFSLSPQSAGFTAPSIPGEYDMIVMFRLTHEGVMTRWARIPFMVKGYPETTITAPAVNLTSGKVEIMENEKVDFTGLVSKLGYNGGTIDAYAWAELREGTGSYNGTACWCDHGIGNKCFDNSGSTEFSISSLSPGDHKICFNARQKYSDDSTNWSRITGHIDVHVNGNDGCNPVNHEKTLALEPIVNLCLPDDNKIINPVSFNSVSNTWNWTCETEEINPATGSKTIESCYANKENNIGYSCGTRNSGNECGSMCGGVSIVEEYGVCEVDCPTCVDNGREVDNDGTNCSEVCNSVMGTCDEPCPPAENISNWIEVPADQ